jgi:hypothetical protein
MIARRIFDSRDAAGNSTILRMHVQVERRMPPGSAPAAEIPQCGISGLPVGRRRIARRLGVSSGESLGRSVFRQIFATAAEPEPLIINR